MNMIEAYKRSFKNKIEQAETEIEKFKQKLETSPAYAFEWGTGALEAAGTLAVYKSALVWLIDAEEKAEEPSETRILNTIEKEAKREVLRRSRYVASSSSSQLSNLMEQYTLAAWAKLLEELDGRF